MLQEWGWPALPISGDGNLQLTASGNVNANAPLKPTVNGELQAINVQKQQLKQSMHGGVISGGVVAPPAESAPSPHPNPRPEREREKNPHQPYPLAPLGRRLDRGKTRISLIPSPLGGEGQGEEKPAPVLSPRPSGGEGLDRGENPHQSYPLAPWGEGQGEEKPAPVLSPRPSGRGPRDRGGNQFPPYPLAPQGRRPGMNENPHPLYPLTPPGRGSG